MAKSVGLSQTTFALTACQSGSNTRLTTTVKGEDPNALTEDPARRLLATAIADRFHLKFHRVVEETSVYALLVDKNGPKLKPSSPDATRDEKIFKGHLTATKYDVACLAHRLYQELDRRVIDHQEFDWVVLAKFQPEPELCFECAEDRWTA